MRMSTIGTMMPRRLTTPLMNAGALAMRVGSLVAADLLHLQDLDAVFLGAEREGQEFAQLLVAQRIGAVGGQRRCWCCGGRLRFMSGPLVWPSRAGC